MFTLPRALSFSVELKGTKATVTLPAGHAAPAVVFLQYGSQETFLTPERARLYAAVVSDPKRFELYDAPHALNAAARRDRIAFLTEQLKLKPLPAARIASIPDLFQPATQN